MIAEAIKRDHPHYERVMVDLATIRWSNPTTNKRYVALTPESAAYGLVEFDQGHEVEPFAFTAHVVQVTDRVAVVKDPDGQLSLTGAGGAKVKQPSRKKAFEGDTIVGGHPLPTGHLSNIKKSRSDLRVFGRRLLRG